MNGLLQDTLYTIFLRSPNNLFDEFILECQKWYESPAHSFSEMRMRDNKKIRGDIFEEFCLLYLKFVKGYKNVWLLKDVPDELLEKLVMKRRDMGIDLIIETHDSTYIAIQCKYKKHVGTRQNILSWKALSTFYALCLRSGPWDKYIVMTNCVYTRHQGKKTTQDVSYCLKTLQNITKDEWLRMCNVHGAKLGTEEVKEKNTVIEIPIKTHIEIPIKTKTKTNGKLIVIPSPEELRNLRNSYYT
jgi:predicted helicase